MNLKYSFLIFLFFSCFNLSAQTDSDTLKLDWEDYDPPSTLVVPETIITRAKYPFIDVHSHQWRMDEMDLNDLIRPMDSMNMGIMNNLSGRNGEKLKKMMDNVNANFPNRFIVFSNIQLRSIDEPDWAEETVKQLMWNM